MLDVNRHHLLDDPVYVLSTRRERLALRAHRIDGVVATQLPGSERHIYAATYGEPPDPPATAALLAALAETATATTSPAVTPSV